MKKPSPLSSNLGLLSLGAVVGFLVFLGFSLLKVKLPKLPEITFRKAAETGLNLPSPGKVKAEYQAVFLTNGQVYFGKLTGFMAKEPRLTDVYYLRVQRTLQPSEQESGGEVKVEEKTEASPASPKVQNELTLIKLGDEVHGPKDELKLNPQHILFVEDLKEDSKVVKAIREFKEKNK